MKERWRRTTCDHNYEVSDRGRLRTYHVSSLKPALVRSTLNGGYPRVFLVGLGKRRYVHQLVAEAFIGPRPAGLVVCHGNDIKTDNRLSNLSYGTRRQNALDGVRNGTDKWRGSPAHKKQAIAALKKSRGWWKGKKRLGLRGKVAS